MNNLELKKMANEVRKGIVSAVHSAKAGHPGGSLSAADIYTYPMTSTRSRSIRRTAAGTGRSTDICSVSATKKKIHGS